MLSERHITLLAAILTVCAASHAQSPDTRSMVLDMMRQCSPCFRTDTASISIAGDFMMHKAQIENASLDGSHSFEGCLAPVKYIMQEADLAVGNMEFTLAGQPYTGYPSFSSPEAFPEYIADCGMDVFLLANNHILDKGADGTERTIAHYRKMQESHGIRFTGCASSQEEFERSNPLYVRLNGIKTAFVNFTYGTNTFFPEAYPKVSRMSKKSLGRLFSKARDDGAEIIIALPHWGPEYSLKSSEEQRETARWLADCGADIIIGSHPHVVQECDTVYTAAGRAVPVIYSLGNAISNMSAKNTRIGLIATIRLTRDSSGKAVILPPEYTYTWCSLPGRLTGRHTVIPVREYIGRRSEWDNTYDYDLMIQTYSHVKDITGIQD